MNKKHNAIARKVKDSVRMPHCEYCGAYKTQATLEVHEIYSRGSYGPLIPENMITLCTFPNDCHGRAQRYEITRDELFTLVAQRLEVPVKQVTKIIEEQRRDHTPWKYR